MQFKFDLEDECVSIQTQGKITQSGFDPNKEPLTELLGTTVFSRVLLLDLSGSDYIDSSGVGWLLTCHKRCREAGGCMILHSLPPMVWQILRVLHMDQIFNIADDAASAKSLVQAGELK